MLLRKKVITFARLGGKRWPLRFPPSAMDQKFQNRVQKTDPPPFVGAQGFFDQNSDPPHVWALNLFFLNFLKKTLVVTTGRRF